MQSKPILVAALLLTATKLWAWEQLPGSVVGRHIFGVATDAAGEPLMVDGRTRLFPRVGFAKTIEREGRFFIVSGFDDVVGGLYLSRCDKKLDRCLDTRSFNLGEVGGLSSPRGAVLTPWNTVLFGEAGLADASNAKAFIERFKPFYKGKPELVRPYNYGWLAEAIVLDSAGGSKLIKNYAAGRVFASELFIMPDGRSLYLFDKDNHGLLYLFVADDPNSLSSGSLYGVSIDKGRVVYDLLGNTSALKMKFKLKHASFDKIYESVAPESGQCPAPYTHVSVAGDECLKVKKQYRDYAGLFEPARTFAMKSGGTPLTRFQNIELTNESASLTTASGSLFTLGLARSEEPDSNYVIQELP